jgi:hypothetical protein
MSSDQMESTRTKIALLVLDKLVLALIIAGAGFFFNFLLQQEKTRGDYQKQLFERRVQAYITILEQAKQARDLLAILYRAQGQEELGELWRREHLQVLLWRAQRLHSDQGGFGESSTWVRYEEVLEPLIEIERVTREADLYISDYVKVRVGEFLEVVIRDLAQGIQNVGQRKESAKSPDKPSSEEAGPEEVFDRSAWKRAEEAYRYLRDELRHRLRFEGIPIG